MMKIHWNKGNELVHYGSAGIDMFGYRSKRDHMHNKQIVISERFRFDFVAKESVKKALRDEIPKFIHKEGKIVYSNLLNTVFNHTPAQREIISEVLWEGVENKELIIPRREVANIKDSDVIKVSPQRVITFGKREK